MNVWLVWDKRDTVAEYVPYSGNRYTEVPHGIGCERCHGPGELHVEKRYNTKYSDSTKKEIDKTIVNPRSLPPALQMDVCFQCHLQGEVDIFKPGKQKNLFRPGMSLQEVRSVYVIDVNFTEHWIQKEPAVSQTARAVTTPRLKDFFGEKDAGADLRLGMAYLQFYDAAKVDRADFERALYLVSKGLQNDPTNEEGLYRLGLAYFQLGRLGEAMQQFRALIKIAPQHALGHTQLAMVLDKMGRREEAVESYEKTETN